MEFKSILYADTNPEINKIAPAFFQDLQLDYLLGLIERSAKDYDIRQYYYSFPGSVDLIKYRQNVFSDLSNVQLKTAIKTFCFTMQKSRAALDLCNQSEGAVQSASFYIEAADLYWHAVTSFLNDLSECSLSADGFTLLVKHLEKHIHDLREAGFEQAILSANDFFASKRFKLHIDNEYVTITEAVDEENNEEDSAKDADLSTSRNYLKDLASLLSFGAEEEDFTVNDIFPNILEPSYMESVLMNTLMKNNKALFKDIRSFQSKFPDYQSKLILNFEKEVQFYISFIEFKEKTQALGYPFCTANISDTGCFSGSDVYDLALVWKNSNSDYNVVSNNFKYNGSASFFVVTGPNQGGKTTFARSLGQAVYFSMMGLYTNASSISLPLFNGIMTHFEAEEVLQSNSGKLKEELNRLAPMMKQEKRNSFVILNELFTTATTHDALIMGRKVMEHFLSRDCYGIYVTHIQELAEETDSIISLVAQLEDGSNHKRTFRMINAKAQGYGYSDYLVSEFNLNYEDIIRRLS